MTKDFERRLEQLRAALEVYLECVELADRDAIDRRIHAHPELRDLVLAMLDGEFLRGGANRNGPVLGHEGTSADDAPPA